jgi:hypothetical protein
VKTSDSEAPPPLKLVKQMLTLRQIDPDLAPLQGPAAFQHLSTEEREQWTSFWNGALLALREAAIAQAATAAKS